MKNNSASSTKNLRILGRGTNCQRFSASVCVPLSATNYRDYRHRRHDSLLYRKCLFACFRTGSSESHVQRYATRRDAFETSSIRVRTERSLGGRVVAAATNNDNDNDEDVRGLRAAIDAIPAEALENRERVQERRDPMGRER